MAKKLEALSRRTFLRGMGLSIALPYLEAMTPFMKSAHAQAVNPMRSLFLFYPNGTHNWEEWSPSAFGRNHTLAYAHSNKLAQYKQEFQYCNI